MNQAKFFSRDLFYIFICAYIVLQIIDLCRPGLFFLNLFDGLLARVALQPVERDGVVVVE